MEFRDSYRMEAIYFQTLKEEINRVKALMASGNTEQAKTLLENAVNVDGAVLLLYRNLGELWGELGAKIEEVKKELEKLDSRVDDYHRELNEKIDDVNNTIIRLINALEERVKALEECCEDVQEALANKQDKLTAGEGITIDNNNVISAPKELYPILLTFDPATGDPSIDKTYQEIKDAYNSGKLPIMYYLYTEDDPEEPFYSYKVLYFDTDEMYDGMLFYEVKNNFLLSGVSGSVSSMFTKAIQEMMIIEPDDTINKTQSSVPITSTKTLVSTQENGNTITLMTKFSELRNAFIGVGVLIRTGPSTNYVQQEVIEMGFDEANHVYYAKTLDKTYITNDVVNGYAVYTRA